MTSVSIKLGRALAVLALVGSASVAGQPAARAASQADTSAPAAAIAPSAGEPARRPLELEQIVVTGNSRVAESEVLGTLQLSVGDQVNATVLEDARLRLLYAHDLLRSVDFAARPGSERGLVILDVKVTERNPVTLETGFGLHDNYGWFLTLLGVRVDPAAASGTELGLGIRLGFKIAGVDGKFERRSTSGGLGFGGNFHLYAQQHLFFADGVDTTGVDATAYPREFRQDIGRAGAELYLLYEARRSTRFSFGFQVEAVRPESSFVETGGGRAFPYADFPSSLKPDIKHTVITGLYFRLVRDTRDRIAYPRSGSFALFQLQSNNRFLGGDEIFARAKVDFRKHVDLDNWRVLTSRLAVGFVSGGAPYHERFNFGGIYTVRGFRELSLSPTSGDDGVALASCELRFPLIAAAKAPPRLTGLLFVDAGYGWRWGEPTASSAIQAAAGYGVRLRLPWLGMLGVDAGIPFTDGRTGDRFYVHGSLGFSF